MLSRFTPTLRSTLARRAPLSPASANALAGSLLLRASPSAFQTRGAANSTAQAPGSQSVGHAATNIKEEVGSAAAEAAKIIGGNTAYGSTEFQSITSDIAETVPKPVMMWGLAGTIPYAATAAASAWTARNASLVMGTGGEDNYLSLLASMQTFQITYGAVILSFLGAIHWGFEFAKVGGEQGHKRLALGTLPLVLAWPTLYIANPAVALIAQWGGFLTSWLTDRYATGQDWTPVWYSQYRFYLTALVGGSVLFSLATTEYYSVSDAKMIQDHSSSTAGLNDGAKKLTQKQIDELPVNFAADKSGESFGKISKKVSPEEKKEKEEAAKKEAEEKEKKEKEAKAAADKKDDKKEKK